MKKRFLFASLASLALLVSCGKTLSYDEAKKHCDDNYSQSAASEKYSACSVKTVTDISKAEGMFESLYKTGKNESTANGVVAVMTSTGLATYGSKATYKASGKAMSISYSADAKEFLKEEGVTLGDKDKYEGKMSYSVSINADGLITKSVEKMDIDFSMTTLGVTVSGAVKGTITTTYSYTAK